MFRHYYLVVLDASLVLTSTVCDVCLTGGHWIVSGDETRQRVKFTDDRVCKSHLLNCCPHDILSGTVSALWPQHFILQYLFNSLSR